MKVGDRVTLRGLRMVRRTSYHNDDMTRLIWRHQFASPCGRKFVYSGVMLKIWDEDKAVDIRATVKRYERLYGFTRLSRPVIIEPLSKGEKLL